MSAVVTSIKTWRRRRPGVPARVVGISGAAVRARIAQLRWLTARSLEEGASPDAHARVEERLDEADQLAHAAEQYSFRRFHQRWLLLEAAWKQVHVADESLVTLVPAEMVRARAVAVYEDAGRWFARDDDRMHLVGPLVHVKEHAVTDDDRYALAGLLHAVHREMDQSCAQMRTFRNIIVTAALLMALAMVLLIGIGGFWPDALPLCASGGGATGRPPVCPTGRVDPSGGDVALVALVGMISAGLSAVQAISTLGESIADPFHTPIIQGLLKVPIGAISAVLGVLAVEEGLDAGAGIATTQGGILVVAFVLGYSQQLLTRVVDQRGSALRASLPPATRSV